MFNTAGKPGKDKFVTKTKKGFLKPLIFLLIMIAIVFLAILIFGYTVFKSQSEKNELTKLTISGCVSQVVDKPKRFLACNEALAFDLSKASEATVRGTRALLATQTGHLQTAAIDFNWLAENDPENLQHQLNLALFFSPSDYEKANIAFENSLVLASTASEKKGIKALYRNHLNSSSLKVADGGDFKAAVNISSKALALVSDDPEKTHHGLTTRGRLFLRAGNESAALNDWAQAIRVEPSYPWAYIARGFYYSANGSDARALADLHKAYARQSKVVGLEMPTQRYGELLRAKGRTALEEGDWSEAALNFSFADPVSSLTQLSIATSFFQNLADSMIAHGQGSAALHVIEDARLFLEELDSERLKLDFDLRLALINAKLGQKETAQKVVNIVSAKAHKLSPNEQISQQDISEVFIRVGQAFSFLGDENNAMLSFQKAAKIENKTTTAFYNLAVSLHRLGDHKNAVEVFDLAAKERGFLRRFPADARKIPFYRGISKFGLKNYKGAHADLTAFTLNSGSNPLALFWRGRAEMALGNVGLAMADFDESLPKLGVDMVVTYQMALQNKGMYKGLLNGRYDSSTRRAFKRCAEQRCF